MQLYVVRHADAGSRGAWVDDDRLRPLSALGERQARGIGAAFAATPIDRVCASPAIRCIQTVQPLADALGLEVEVHDCLMEGSWVPDVVALAESIEGNAVFSSHGDVIPELIRAFCNRGMNLLDDYQWAKGSIWVVTRDGDKFTEARYVPPPAMT